MNPFNGKYLLNLPLGIAALAQTYFVVLAVMPGPWGGWSDGPSRAAMAWVMLQPAALAWLLLLATAIGAAFTDAFDWLLPGQVAKRRAAVIAGSVALAAASVPCMMVAIGGSAAVGDSDTMHIAEPLVIGARIAGTIVPLITMGWLAWLVDAPPHLRAATLPRATAMGGLILTGVTGGIIGAGMIHDEIVVQRGIAMRDKEMIDERERAINAGFAALTDASTLLTWRGYTDRFTPEPMRQAALQRIAKRPALEPELTALLADPDIHDAEQSFVMAGLIPFAPSAALEQPLRAVIARLAKDIRTSRREGSHDFDQYADSWYPERLAAVISLSKKMADGAGIDMRDALAQMRQALLDAYPHSKVGRSFPGEVAATDKYIDAALAARRKAN